MAAERPIANSFWTNELPKQKVDSFWVGDGKTEVLPPKKKEESIYRKGGIFDQFGPNPKTFNPTPGRFGGFVQAGADQPGSALPFVGQAAGGYAGPMGGVAGALVGEGIRQGIGRIYGVQDEADPMKQFKSAGKAAVISEALGFGANKALQGGASAINALKPRATETAVRSTRNLIRPTGRLAKKGERLAKAALEEGVISSDLRKMKSNIGEAKSGVDDEIDKMIQEFSDRSFTGEGALHRVDALARRYMQLGDPDAAAKVLSVKNNLIKAYRLHEPVYGEKEVGQFVMGPASKSTTPQIKETFSKDMTGGLKQFQNKARYEPVRTKSGAFGRSEAKREFLTPKTVVESPEDIVALNVPGGPSAKPRKIVSVSPKESYSLRPETKGVSKKEIVKIGTKPRQIQVPEGQGIKRGQFRLLESKKVGGGYGSETTSPEIGTRQQFASGIRRDIVKQVPEIDPLNKRYADLIDLEKAVSARENVASRNDLLSLKDVITGAAGAISPKAFAMLLLRKGAQAGQGQIAKGLYKFGKSGPITAPQISPVVRALLGAQLREAA